MLMPKPEVLEAMIKSSGCIRFGVRASCLGILAAVSVAFAAVDPAKLDAANELYNTRGKSLEAQKAYEAIAAEDPTHATAQMRLGILALRRDDTDAAIAYLEKA